MNPGRFYIPPYMGIGNNMISNGIRATGPMIRMANNTSRGMGIFSKITSGIRSVNWGGLLNNANKTLNVVNQTIPLVRQVGPMVNNMKSMLRVARAFGNETIVNKNNNNIANNISNNESSIINSSNQIEQKKEVIDNNTLNFFI